jgi:hypothetical protein
MKKVKYSLLISAFTFAISINTGVKLYGQTDKIEEPKSVSSQKKSSALAENPTIHTIPAQFKSESIVYVKDSKTLTVFASENDEVYIATTYHQITHINDEKGIEMVNTFVVPTPYNGSIIELEARTIKANNKVVEIKNESVKINKDEYDKEQYHIAYEDLNIGDEVEIYYTEVRPFKAFGSVIMQVGIACMEGKFEMVVPKSLEYKFKGYNGFSEFKESINEETGYKHYVTIENNIPAIDEEKYAYVQPNLMRVEYKMSKTPESPALLNTWNDYAKNTYSNVTETTTEENKAVDKFISTLNIPKSATEREKIILLEAKIKKDFVYNDDLYQDEFRNLAKVIQDKTSGEIGIVRLYVAVLSKLGIAFEIAVGANKFEYPLDKDFENWYRPTEFLIYITSQKQYLMPTYTTSRFPNIPYQLRNTAVLTFQNIKVGNLTSATAKFRNIEREDAKFSQHATFANIQLDVAQLQNNVQMKNTFTGYSAYGIREAFVYSKKENIKEIVGELSYLINNPDELVEYSYKNEALDNYVENIPLEVNATIKNDVLLEKAGNDILFKIGDVIGPQEQMYQEKARIFDIAMPFAHELNREITLEIPDGYHVENLKDLNIKVIDDTKQLGFVSSYTIENNKLKVLINEYYNISDYPKDKIEQFRAVINAAADFNKITLILKKK